MFIVVKIQTVLWHQLPQKGSTYDDLSPVTVKISGKVLFARNLHEDTKDEHEPQCEQFLTDGLKTYYFHWHPF